MSIDQHSTTADLLLGAVAGGAAAVALGGVTSALYEREDRPARRREDRARGGKSAYEVAADRVAKGVGVGLSKEQRSLAGTAIHPEDDEDVRKSRPRPAPTGEARQAPTAVHSRVAFERASGEFLVGWVETQLWPIAGSRPSLPEAETYAMRLRTAVDRYDGIRWHA